MELLFIRHALPLRVEGFEGPADPELSEAGQHQARHLAEYLAFERIHAVVRQPAAAGDPDGGAGGRAGSRSRSPIADGIAEYDREAAEYIPIEQLKAEGLPGWQDVLTGDVHRTAGVDPHEFRAGVVEAVEAIIAAHPGEKVAAVCHGGVINAYLTHILGIADPSGFFYPNYTSIHRIAAARSGERSVLSLNETCHLRGHRAPGRAVRRVLTEHRGPGRPVELGRIVQVAYAVDDVRAAARSFAERVGAGPFFVRHHDLPRRVDHRGAAGEFDHSSAYGQWGAVQVELVEVHRAEPASLAEIVQRSERDPPRRHVRRVDRRRAALASSSWAGRRS